MNKSAALASMVCEEAGGVNAAAAVGQARIKASPPVIASRFSDTGLALRLATRESAGALLRRSVDRRRVRERKITDHFLGIRAGEQPREAVLARERGGKGARENGTAAGENRVGEAE